MYSKEALCGCKFIIKTPIEIVQGLVYIKHYWQWIANELTYYVSLHEYNVRCKYMST